MSNPVDVGHDVTVELRYVGEEFDGVAYTHTCNGQAGSPDYVGVKPAWRDGWDVLSVNPLTLSPSLLCRACGHHGFIREGKWVPA